MAAKKSAAKKSAKKKATKRPPKETYTKAEQLRLLKGRDATRVRQLARNPKVPKYALGQVVLEPRFGFLGAIDAIYADLDAAVDAKVIPNAKEFLDFFEHRPRTPKNGIWYTVVIGDGAELCGEKDIAPVED